MIHFQKHLIPTNFTVRQALEAIDQLSGTPALTVFVIEEKGEVIGSVTDGDIRRGIIKGIHPTDPVTLVMKQEFMFLTSNGYGPKELKEIKAKGIQLLPILDHNNRICRLIDLQQQRSFLPIDAVIMAGGEGKRLRPLTSLIPKPLLKIGKKPILEHNIDRLVKYGISNISISVKYLGHQIRDYFGDGLNKGIRIEYVEETLPRGTAGSLQLVKHLEHDVILLMNSDLLTNIDFEDMYFDFIEKQADLSVATVPYNVKVPYAVMEMSDSNVLALKEKPTYTYYSNSGIYLFKRDFIEQFIPADEYFDATDFIECLIAAGHKVISYPICSYWLDIGRKEDYERANEDIKHIEL